MHQWVDQKLIVDRHEAMIQGEKNILVSATTGQITLANKAITCHFKPTYTSSRLGLMSCRLD